MNRALAILNAIGVLALALLCVVQWQRDRRVHMKLIALQRTNQFQFASMVEQSNTMRGVNEDIVRFKERFTRAHSDLTDARAALRKTERENEELVSERDQLKVSITNWGNAVAERDEQLKLTTARAQDLAAKLNESITRFNELVTNYNGSVQRFNGLATNYNNVVEELNNLRRSAKAESASTASK